MIIIDDNMCFCIVVYEVPQNVYGEWLTFGQSNLRSDGQLGMGVQVSAATGVDLWFYINWLVVYQPVCHNPFH